MEEDELALTYMAPPPAKAKVRVLMVPLPAQSHLNQLLHLGRLIADCGIPVHYTAPAAHNQQARLRAYGWSEDDGVHHDARFQFHDLPFPTDIPSPPPDPNEPNKFPAHLQPLFDAAEPNLRRPLAAVIRSLAAVTDRLAVVHDTLMSFIASEACMEEDELALTYMAPPPAKAKVRVLMVPFPVQSHLNQLLHLGRLIADRGIPVHYAAPAAHNQQARLRAYGWSEDDGHVHHDARFNFHDLPFPTNIPSPPPDPNEPNKFPAHLQPLFDAAEPNLRRPLAAVIRSLAAVTDRLAVVHDALMSFIASEVVLLPNSKAYAFGAVGVFNGLKSEDIDALTDEQRQELAPLIAHSGFSHTAGCFTNEFLSFIYHQVQYRLQFVTGVIYNSHKSIEGKYIPLLGYLKNKSVWMVGPLNLPNKKADKTYKQHPCIAWLDKQPLASVIYVSFGTMTSISDEQIDEIATGLKRSGHRFLWVLREADRCNIFVDQERCYKISEEYEQEVKEMGIVVRDWVPQLEILGHEAVGGFMSHCGWNSCMESLSMGKPIAAWPMASDQPKNAVLLTEELKVGLMVRDWTQWAEVVPANKISVAVKKLLDSKEGDNMRTKANELGVELRMAYNEGGVSSAELDSFVAHISL